MARKAVKPTPAFVVLSFEGPDAYSRAGGLVVRVSGLAGALAEERTRRICSSSARRPGHETACGGKLHLHRWCEWISRYHPGGVYVQ